LLTYEDSLKIRSPWQEKIVTHIVLNSVI